MAVTTTVKTIGSTGTFSTIQAWHDGAPTNLVTAERSACGTFAVATFLQGESLTFSISGATGKMLDTDSTGVGTGTYMTYGITAGNPGAADVITGLTSTATCVLTSGTPDFTGVIWQGQCQNQEFSSAGTLLTVSGTTTSTTAYKELTTVAGASFRDHANVLTNPLRYNASVGAAINCTLSGGTTLSITESNFHMSKLQLTASGPLGRCLTGNAGTGILIDSCICEGNSVASGVSTGPFVIPAATGTYSNCVFIGRGSGADHIIQTNTGSPSFFNCAMIAPTNLGAPPTSIFTSGASGTVTVQNCALFGGEGTSTVKAGSATFNFTTCVSDTPGTVGVATANFDAEYENAGKVATDLRLTLMSAQIDSGTTDVTNAATDIKGTARPAQAAYDIGPWESNFTVNSKFGAPYFHSRRPRTHDAISKRKGQAH